ncbi:MGH1-like glycoside hydrolase domain-containing protein [Paenibacillus glycinis]|uniref:Alpha-L-rhamnosidase six-hairpin glycosidase domain-containing protein n=1 Tax=Paenibacillus glycinis TaxID=2697035 RepID=A0ABW9XPM8_9BACL|nr:glycosyl hydrolase family 65 protein [Paenibacillus glycinis]NBD24585.1 hypothetical protein [Paenibacillus glycinis]
MSKSKLTSSFTLQSSSARLDAAARWATGQALAYASVEDPVGLWYEAALPGREAFCMRDVAHMSAGAAALGLGAHTKNMLLQFAAHISASKDWCTYWEITKDGLPCPDDYTNDADFWYNLPANFDVVDCCYRQYLWSGDRDYLQDERFLQFYERSLNEYVRRWDRDGDGIPDHIRGEGRRGIASYVEDALTPKVAGDLVAAQYAAYNAYAAMSRLRGEDGKAEQCERLAGRLRELYDTQWWNEGKRRFNGAILQDGTPYEEYYLAASFLPLYFGLIPPGEKRALALEDLKRGGVSNVEEMSHLPDVYYASGEREEAFRTMLELSDERTARREYPEVSYSVIGNIVTGLLGVRPLADRSAIEVAPQLPGELQWVKAQGIALLGNRIGVDIRDGRLTVTNEEGPVIQVRAGDRQLAIGERESGSFELPAG